MFCASYVPSKCLKGASKVLQCRLQSEAVTQGHSCLGSLSSCPNIVTIPSQVTAKLVKMPADQWWWHSTACLSCRTFQWHAIAELMDKLNFNYYSGQVEDQSRINTKDILGIGRGLPSELPAFVSLECFPSMSGQFSALFWLFLKTVR